MYIQARSETEILVGGEALKIPTATFKITKILQLLWQDYKFPKFSLLAAIFKSVKIYKESEKVCNFLNS